MVQQLVLLLCGPSICAATTGDRVPAGRPCCPRSALARAVSLVTRGARAPLQRLARKDLGVGDFNWVLGGRLRRNNEGSGSVPADFGHVGHLFQCMLAGGGWKVAG